MGGDCHTDVAMLRAEPAVFGPVASDPTVSRLVGTLAACGDKVLRAMRAARSEVRERVWQLAGEMAPDAGGAVTVDLDGVLVIAHSDKEDGAPTWKKTYGHHPLRRSSTTDRAAPGNPSLPCSDRATRAASTGPTALDLARTARRGT
jgi:hypothetical protein